MEWKYWLKDFSEALGFLWSGNEDFMNYLQTDGRENDFVTFLMGTVPSPRYEYYQNADFSKTKASVLGHFSEVIDKLGTYYV